MDGVDAVTLRGSVVTLVPVSLGHVDALVEAANLDRSTYGFTPVPADAASMHASVASQLAEYERRAALPFTVTATATGEALGQTRLFTYRSSRDVDRLDAVEIGGTWLAATAQRTAVNTEAKRLLLAHAFDVMGVERVELRTDVRNARSRAAILRIGATFEGVLRAWQPSFVPGEEGLLRDTAMFSVVRSEWPSVRAALDERRSR
jgi:RimJ/RimL family protein N-acetyltransferase